MAISVPVAMRPRTVGSSKNVANVVVTRAMNRLVSRPLPASKATNGVSEMKMPASSATLRRRKTAQPRKYVATESQAVQTTPRLIAALIGDRPALIRLATMKTCSGLVAPVDQDWPSKLILPCSARLRAKVRLMKLSSKVGLSVEGVQT